MACEQSGQRRAGPVRNGQPGGEPATTQARQAEAEADAACIGVERFGLSGGKGTRNGHIDALFDGNLDGDLIATNARDVIQLVLSIQAMLSIQAGRAMPSMLLRKLGTHSRHSLLYRAFCGLSRVERTLFLLHFFSSAEVCRPACAHAPEQRALLPGSPPSPGWAWSRAA